MGEGSLQGDPARTQGGGRRFGVYQLVRQIGFGGGGAVYEAQHTVLNRTVALKLMLDSKACSPLVRRRFLIEAEAAARLDHPNIVAIYEVGEFEDQPYLCMKLVEGESLRSKIKSGAFCLPKHCEVTRSISLDHQRRIARLVAAVARAVDHAHSHNVVHRDLKPGNIIVDHQGTPHLTDFGMAKIIDDRSCDITEHGAMLGTLFYMAPEQVRCEPVTAAVDTYGLGVILFEVLTGQPAFRGATAHETMRLIKEQPATQLRKLNRHIDRDLETICLKCLEKSPANRYSTAADVADDLERWLHREPIRGRRTGPMTRANRWIWRNPEGTGFIVSLAMALLLAVFLFLQKKESYQLERDRNAIIIQNWSLRTEEAWRNEKLSNIVFRAEEIANLVGRREPAPSGAQRHMLEVNINQGPVVQAGALFPLLDHLQKSMSRSLRRPVVFDLKFCKLGEMSLHEILSEGSDFQRLGAVSYLRAKEANPGIHAVVQEDGGKNAVILVRRDSPITNLTQFAGASFAFGDTNSTMNVLAKAQLYRAGVSCANLQRFTNYSEGALGECLDPAETLDPKRAAWAAPVMASSGRAVKSVQAGEYDGAVLQRKYFAEIAYKKPGLREVFSFTNTPNVYVARAGLPTNVIVAFRDAMLTVKDEGFARQLPHHQLENGFELPDETALATLRTTLTKEATQFETECPAP